MIDYTHNTVDNHVEWLPIVFGGFYLEKLSLQPSRKKEGGKKRQNGKEKRREEKQSFAC